MNSHRSPIKVQSGPWMLAPASMTLLAGVLSAQQPGPADSAAQKARAYQLYEARQFVEAAAQFEAYLGQRPDDRQALLDHALLLIQLNRLGDAARQLELFHQKFPRHEAGYFRLGALAVTMGRTADAEKVFRELQRSSNPEMAAAADQALQELKTGQARATRQAAENRVFDLARATKHEEVVTAVNELEKEGSLSIPLQMQRLYSLSALHRYAEALTHAEKLAQAGRESADLDLVRADLLAQLNRRPEAETIWRRQVERHPGTPAALEASRRLQERVLPPPEDRVFELVRQGRHTNVLSAIADMERTGTLSRSMSMQQVYSLEALGEVQSALVKAEELARLYPEDNDLALLRADLLVRRREWLAAGKILKEVKAAHPATPAASAADVRLRALPPVANSSKGYWGEAYASGDYLGRYGTLLGSGFIRQGAFTPGARWLQPYGEFRFGADTRSGAGARETVVMDNAVGFYGGARAQLLFTEYVFVYAQAGANKDLLDRRERGDWAFDSQAGIYGFKSWGPGTVFQSAPPAGALGKGEPEPGSTPNRRVGIWRGDWFVDAGANFSYYHRYRSWLGYGQAREGFRLAQFGTSVALDAYLLENVTWDVRGNYFDNYFEFGPGARAVWMPHPRWHAVLSTEWMQGYYFGRDDRNTRGRAAGQYDGVRVTLAVGARW